MATGTFCGVHRSVVRTPSVGSMHPRGPYFQHLDAYRRQRFAALQPNIDTWPMPALALIKGTSPGSGFP
jgi:hypothetical protein